MLSPGDHDSSLSSSATCARFSRVDLTEISLTTSTNSQSLAQPFSARLARARRTANSLRSISSCPSDAVLRARVAIIGESCTLVVRANASSWGCTNWCKSSVGAATLAIINRPRGALSSLSQHDLDIRHAPAPLRSGPLELGPEKDVDDARRVRDHHIDGHGEFILGRVVA